MQTVVGLFIVLVIALSMGLQFSTFQKEGFKVKAKARVKSKEPEEIVEPEAIVDSMVNMNVIDDVPAGY